MRETNGSGRGRASGKPTIRDVAEAADVSVGSVSRVLNGSDHVSERLRLKVERAMEELGFVPNVFARGMKGGQTQIIGIVLRDITNKALAGFVRAAEHELERSGYVVMVGCHDSLKDREKKLLQVLAQRHVEGIIMTTSSEDDQELLKFRESLKLPIVLHDRERPSNWDSVRVNYRDVMRRATGHLLGLGHRRLALVTGSLSVYTARDRARGYMDAVREAGLPEELAPISSRSFEPQDTYAEISGLLGRPDRPTGLLLGGIDMLAPALQAIRDHGLSIPGDISLIGSGDSELARLTTPGVTVIAWEYPEVGRACARLLLERLKGGSQMFPRTLMYPAELIIRGSCAAPPDLPAPPRSDSGA